MQCVECEWCKSLEDSGQRTVYYCMNTESSAYGDETGLCGNCNVDGEYNEPEINEWTGLV